MVGRLFSCSVVCEPAGGQPTSKVAERRGGNRRSAGASGGKGRHGFKKYPAEAAKSGSRRPTKSSPASIFSIFYRVLARKRPIPKGPKTLKLPGEASKKIMPKRKKREVERGCCNEEGCPNHKTTNKHT